MQQHTFSPTASVLAAAVLLGVCDGAIGLHNLTQRTLPEDNLPILAIAVALSLGVAGFGLLIGATIRRLVRDRTQPHWEPLVQNLPTHTAWGLLLSCA